MTEFTPKRRSFLIGAGSTLVVSLLPFKAFAQGPTAVCSRVGQKIIFKGKNYICAKSNGKLVWSALVPVKPTILIHPTPSATSAAPSTPSETPKSTPPAPAKTSSSPAPAATPSKVSGYLVGHLSELTDGQSKVVSAKDLTGQLKFVALYLSGDLVIAHSAICTHQGCTVGDSGKQLACPCHGSVFNAQTGAVVHGPAPLPLPAFKVAQIGNDIYIV